MSWTTQCSRECDWELECVSSRPTIFFDITWGTHLVDSAVFPTYPVSTLLSNLFYSYDLDQATKMTSRTPAL